MVFSCTLHLDSLGTASSSSRPSYSHSRNLSSNAPLTDCQDFLGRNPDKTAGHVFLVTHDSPVSVKNQADSECLVFMQETSGYPESFHLNASQTLLMFGGLSKNPIVPSTNGFHKVFHQTRLDMERWQKYFVWIDQRQKLDTAWSCLVHISWLSHLT